MLSNYCDKTQVLNSSGEIGRVSPYGVYKISYTPFSFYWNVL